MRYQIYFRQKGSNMETLFYDSKIGNPSKALTEASLTMELSKAGTLNFTLTPFHPNYGSFHKLSTYIRVVYNESEELFRGRVLDVEDSIYKERKVTCEGDLAYLVDSLQPPDKTSSKDSSRNQDITIDNSEQRNSLPIAIRNQMPEESMTIARANLAQESSTSETVLAHFTRFITNHNAQVDSEKQFLLGNVTVDERNTTQSFTSTSYRDTKSAMDSDFLNRYGGFLQTRPSSGSVPYLDYLKEPTVTSGQPIKMGVNMLDLSDKVSGTDIFTVFVPIGSEGLNISSVNEGEIGIEIPEAVSEYGYIYKTESYSNVKTAAELKTIGEAYVAANYKGNPHTITTKALDLNLLDDEIDSLRVGTKVNVQSEPHNLNTTLTCTKIDYDLLNPENTSYEIGDASETLSQKNNSYRVENEENVADAVSKGSYASSAALDLEAAVNRHAQNITDIADGMYNLQADEITVRARVVSVEADLINIHTHALDIAVDGTVTVTADVIILDGLRIEPDSEFDVSMHGSVWADYLNTESIKLVPDVGCYLWYGSTNYTWVSATGVNAPVFNVTKSSLDGGSLQFLSTGDNGILTYIDAQKVKSHEIKILNPSGNPTEVSLRDSVVSFGTVTYSGNTVNIPYTTAGGTTGTLSFSKTASIDGDWSSGIYKVTATDDTANPKTVLLQTQLFGLNKVLNSETVSGTNVTGQAEVMYYDPTSGSVYNWSGTGYIGNITLDASQVATDAAAAAQAAVTMSKEWGQGANAGRLTVSNSANARVVTAELSTGTATWSGATATIPVKDGNTTVTNFTLTAPLDTPSAVTPTTSQQTVSPGQNKIGLTSVTVNAAPISAQKTATPTFTEQIISPNNSDLGLASVKVRAAVVSNTLGSVYNSAWSSAANAWMGKVSITPTVGGEAGSPSIYDINVQDTAVASAAQAWANAANRMSWPDAGSSSSFSVSGPSRSTMYQTDSKTFTLSQSGSYVYANDGTNNVAQVPVSGGGSFDITKLEVSYCGSDTNFSVNPVKKIGKLGVSCWVRYDGGNWQLARSMYELTTAKATSITAGTLGYTVYYDVTSGQTDHAFINK